MRRILVSLLFLMCAQSAVFSATALSFADFDQRANRGEVMTVAFCGGSLTWGAQATDPLKTSYRALISQQLSERYPDADFTFVDAAIGGTGSQLGAYRLERDVLAYDPDLVFLDFTVNDGAHRTPTDDRLSSYESLVRRMVKAGIPVVQVLLAVKEDLAQEAPERPLDALHQAIGEAYNLPVADVVSSMRKAVLEDHRATPDELWDLPYDQTHPGDAGYALYAECVWRTFLDAVSSKHVCELSEAMLHPDHYMQVDRFVLAQLSRPPQGWSAGVPHRNAVAFDFVCSRWMDDLLIAEATETTKPAVLKLRFTGQTVLLFGEGTKQSGRYEVVIDGGDPVSYEAKCADGNMRLVKLVAHDLDPSTSHTIEIRPILVAGEELRLHAVCVAGGSVTSE